MKREHWKDLFEAIGLVAVIASLIFVGIETRNNANQAAINTRAIEIASYQELTNNIVAANLIQVGDESLIRLQLKAASDPGSLTELERRRYGVWVISRLRHADLAYFQYERGIIDEDRMRSVLGPLEPMFRNERAIYVWESLQDNFVESFRNYMTDYIEEITLRDNQEVRD